MKPVLEVTDLVKEYGPPEKSFRAVDHVTFSIGEGEVLGLLGPNGAGKTTTIQMLLGLTTPTSGSISYFGLDFQSHREEILQKINFVSAYNQMQGRATVRQNIGVFSRIYGIDNWEEKLSELSLLLGVTDKLDTLCWHLSSGERTRVNMVKALLNNPRLILMDEPTASLDPEIVQVVLDLVDNLRRREKVAILYTSHNMGEVTRVCDRVAFMDHGKIVVVDTPLGLSKRVGSAQLLLTFDGSQKPVREYLERKKMAHSFVRSHLVSIPVAEADIPKVLFGLGEDGVWITDITINKPDMEDVFLAIAEGGIHALEKN